MSNSNNVKAVALLLLCSTAAFAFLVQQYLAERAKSNGLEAGLIPLLDVIDSTQKGAAALGRAESTGRIYLLTHDPADRARYRQSLQEWNDESGVLELLASQKYLGNRVQIFREAGSKVEKELGTVIGSSDSALPRSVSYFPTSVDTQLTEFEKLTASLQRVEYEEPMLLVRRFQSDSGWFRRRELAVLGVLFCLMVLEAGWLVKAVARPRFSDRSKL